MIKDYLWSLMTKNITPAVSKKLTTDIMAYVDHNSEILLTLDLSRRYSFGDSDREIVYKAVGVTEDYVNELIRQSKTIYQSNKIQTNPFYILCMSLCSWYVSKKDEKMATLIWTYASLMMFTSINKGFFKHGMQENIWQYTLAHLDNTFSIRNFPSIFAFIQDNTKTVIETYKMKLSRGEDKDIIYVIDATWTRLKGKMKKLATRYYDNHKSGRYLNQDTDSYDSEDFHQMDNVSFATDRLVTKVYTKLINHQFDKRFIKYSVSGTEASYNKIVALIDDIIDSDGADGSLREVISSLISFYLINSGKPISYLGKGDFIAYMKTSFGSNTASPEMAKVKNTIDRWLKDNMIRYGRVSYGLTVQIMYRRVIYMFLVFVINYEAKLQ